MAYKNVGEFYTEWKANLDNLLSGYIHDEKGELNRTRFVFVEFKSYIARFLNGKLDETEKIVLLPGIRGAGKTTLLAQVYFIEKFLRKEDVELTLSLNKLTNKIYISADKLLIENFSLNEFFAFYETQLGSRFENIDKKTLILIDEVQYDPSWALFLKLLFDKIKGHKNVLVIATGSSALLMNSKNTDLVRRSTKERIFPLTFIDYLVLKYSIFPTSNLSNALRQAIFYSKDASEAFRALSGLKNQVLDFWSKIPEGKNISNQFFESGSFPFSMNITNRVLAMERIRTMVLANIIEKDIMPLQEFKSETLAKLSNLLYLLASSDEIKAETLTSSLKMNSRTLANALEALMRAEILFEVHPYGQPYSRIRKFSKFLFLTPNIRLGLLDGMVREDIRGKILEDYCALIFAKELAGNAQFFYDYGKGGADFILRFRDNSEIIIEVGFSKEDVDQIENTAKKAKAKYGVVFGSGDLEIVNSSIVKIPLTFLLLI